MLWLGATHPKTAALYNCRCLQLGSSGTHPAATNSATSTSQLLVQFSACKTAATVMMMVQDASKMRLLELVLLMRQMFSTRGGSAGLQSKQRHRNTALAQRQHTPLVKMQRGGSFYTPSTQTANPELPYHAARTTQHNRTSNNATLATCVDLLQQCCRRYVQQCSHNPPVQAPSPGLDPTAQRTQSTNNTGSHTHTEASAFGSVPRRHHADTLQAIRHKRESLKIHSLRLSIGPCCGRQ